MRARAPYAHALRRALGRSPQPPAAESRRLRTASAAVSAAADVAGGAADSGGGAAVAEPRQRELRSSYRESEAAEPGPASLAAAAAQAGVESPTGVPLARAM